MQQVSTLYCIEEEAESVLTSTGITEEEQKLYATVIAKFNELFSNIIFERPRFNQQNQQDGEMTEAYIKKLYRPANNCNYGDRCAEIIHDKFVVGIRDTALSRHLQLDSELTLEKIIRQQ